MGIPFFTISSFSLLTLFLTLCSALNNSTNFHVGIVLDFESLVGRIGLTSLSLSLTDFYSLHTNYSTRIVLHTRDSKGLVTDAAASALNLLNEVEVDAIIGPQKSAQANFVIGLGDAAKVPIISFSATSPSLNPRTLYSVQTAPTDAAQVDAIATIVKYYRWGQVVIVYEDSDYGNGIVPFLSNAFQDVNARVSYRSVIPVSATDDFILQELYKMKTMQTRVFVVHISSSLASRFFLKVKEAEMMSQGYAWIVTSGLMDLFYSLDPHVVESMQGVIGVKPLIPTSRRLRSTTRRWKRKFLEDNPSISSQGEMSLYGLWAYDTLWALAMAAEKVGIREPSASQSKLAFNSTNMFATEISQTGPKLLGAILGTTFRGLGGVFRLVNGQLETSSFQVLNLVGKELKEVGIWEPRTRNSGEKNVNRISFTGEKLKNITWPGESKEVPKGWEFPVSGKKLKVGVPARAGFTQFVKVERDPQTNASKISGYYIDLFDSVMAHLHHGAVRYEYVPFETNDDSSAVNYDALVYEVYNGMYDAAVGDITITANRSQFVDFTLPIEEGGVTRTQKIQYENPNDEWFFLKPLKKELWLTAIALFILTGVALWILEHRFNRAFRGPPSEHVGLIFYIPFMSLVFAHRERIVSNLARLVVVVWVFVVLILSSTYTASLSARLTAWKLQKADTDVNVLIRNGDYIGCREGSFIFQYLKDLGFDESKIRTYNNPEDVDDALSRGSERGGITALFSRTPYTNLFLSKYCNKYMKVGSPFLTEGFAFAFRKGSPLVADVSRTIIELIDDGRISEIKAHWMKDSACNEDELGLSTASWKNIDLHSFKILFGITGAITTTCLVVFLVTYLYKNRDFIQRISSSSTTIWSKVRALCKHFDQRDPKSFRCSRSKEDDENASPNIIVYPIRRSTIVPVESADIEDANGVIRTNSDHREHADESRSIQLENIRV
ncbi:UNVERIFIED_CONTAM: Glutamate receptor 2.8 [Sesamum indicum]